MGIRGLKKWSALAAVAAFGFGGVAFAQQLEGSEQEVDELIESEQVPDYELPAADDSELLDDSGMGGSGLQSDPMLEDDAAKTEIEINTDDRDTVVLPEESGQGGSGKQSRIERNLPGWADVRVGGGIEAPAARLRDDLAVGPMWSASVNVQPLTWMGVEAAYTGSAFEADSRLTGPDNEGLSNGADFVRNGGQVAAVFNLPTPFLHPYVLGGVGIDRTNFRGDDNGQFRDDTSGRVPVGGGIRASAGPALLDLRANYNVLFDQDFSRTAEGEDPGGTYNVGLQVGAQF